MSWHRLLSAQRVLVSVTDVGLVCCWKVTSRDAWVWRRGTWPPDSCLDGFPLQQDEMGELLADLLLDCDVVGAQIELVLPSSACQWRVVEGLSENGIKSAALAPHQLAALDWPLDADAVDVAVVPGGDAALVVGVQSPLLQAWINVIEVADLPLRRVEWSMAAALRALLTKTEGSTDLAWLIQASQADQRRLVLVHRGIPEVDRLMPASESIDDAISETIAAWRAMNNSVGSLAWCLSLPEASVQDAPPLLDPNAWIDQSKADQVLTFRDLWTPSPWAPELDDEALNPLEHLALAAVRALET